VRERASIRSFHQGTAMTARNLATLATVIVFAALGAGSLDAPSDTSTTSPEAPEQAEIGGDFAARLERLNEVVSELDEDEPYARGEGADAIARAILDELGEGTPVAVDVIAGSPRRILVLAELDGIEREEWQPALLAIRDTFEAQDAMVAIGIKDGYSFCAVLFHEPGQWPPRIETDDPHAVLVTVYEERALQAPPPAPSTP
jgi:hypothetical protein